LIESNLSLIEIHFAITKSVIKAKTRF